MSLAAINPLVTDTGSPPIPEAQGWLARYDGAVGPPVNLSQAAPGQAPPGELLQRLSTAAGSPTAAGYGPILGDAPLREAYAAHLAMVYGGRIGPEDVAITAGCNLAFAAVAMTLARAGDAVIVPAPWYFNHQMTLAMLGVEARPLACRAEAGFVPDPDEAETLIDGTVRALVLVTPNNPTGAVYPPDLVARFAELCARRGIRLVLDETYRDFLPLDLDRAHGLLEGDAWREHVVQLYSFSKAYCMPGHRVGAITADTALIGQIAKVLDCLQICAARPAQAVLPWAIGSLSGWREGNRREIAARAEAFRSAMGRVPGWRVEQVGAYFAYVRHPFSGAPAARAAEALASRRGVLALPGSYFGPGQEGHLRMAFANVGSEVIEALPERLAGLALP